MHPTHIIEKQILSFQTAARGKARQNVYDWRSQNGPFGTLTRGLGSQSSAQTMAFHPVRGRQAWCGSYTAGELALAKNFRPSRFGFAVICTSDGVQLVRGRHLASDCDRNLSTVLRYKHRIVYYSRASPTRTTVLLLPAIQLKGSRS